MTCAWLGSVHLLVLGLLGRGVHLVALAVLLALGVGVLLLLGSVLRLVLLVLAGVGVVAELVAVAEVADDLPREAREGRLVVEPCFKVVERAARRILDEPAPEVEHVGSPRGKRTAGGKLADHVARGGRERRVGGLADLREALARGVGRDLGVDVARGAGHRARADCLAARFLHRCVKLARHLALRLVAVEGLAVVITVAQRQRVGRPARQKHLVPRHPPRDLRQADLVCGHARRVDRIADRQVRVVGHDLRGLGQRLLERIGGVVRGRLHAAIDRAPAGKRQGEAGAASGRRQEAQADRDPRLGRRKRGAARVRIGREGRAREQCRLLGPRCHTPGQRRARGQALRLGMGQDRVEKVEEFGPPARRLFRGGAVEDPLMFFHRQQPSGAVGEDAGAFVGRNRQGRRLGGDKCR